jgi:hypothetical protein
VICSRAAASVRYLSTRQSFLRATKEKTNTMACASKSRVIARALNACYKGNLALRILDELSGAV